jgi:GNAT superfamily N-acetyltransferase
MQAPNPKVVPVSVHAPEARACLERYFAELASRFPEGFDPQADGVAALEDYVPPAGVFLVARIRAMTVGCGALRSLSPGVGEIKRMWVSPEARGQGVGRRLLQALEREARRRNLGSVRLDSHSSLVEALRLYRAAGYRDIARYNDNPHARHWLEKALD